MPSLGGGHIAKFVAAMLSEGIDKTIDSKLEKLGEDFVMKLLAGPAGTAQRAVQALETGGMSEIEKLGDNFWANAQRLSRPDFESKLLKMLSGGKTQRRRIHGEHSARSRSAWSRTDWARSRDDWLDNKWKHDWRSQPRDAQGRWIPGRLRYIEANLQWRGRKMGRKLRRRMQKRRQSRLKGRRLARRMIAGVRIKNAG